MPQWSHGFQYHKVFTTSRHSHDVVAYTFYMCVCVNLPPMPPGKLKGEWAPHKGEQHFDINIPHMPQPFQSTIPSPAMDFPPPLNPNHIFINSSFAPSSSEFEPSDYLLLDDASDEAAAPVAVTGGSSIGATPMMNTTTNMQVVIHIYAYLHIQW